MLIEPISLISVHDTAHDGDSDFPKTTEYFTDLRTFLWAVSNKHIPTLKCAQDLDHAEITDYGKYFHINCIIAASPSSSSTSFTENIEAIQQLAINVQN